MEVIHPGSGQLTPTDLLLEVPLQPSAQFPGVGIRRRQVFSCVDLGNTVSEYRNSLSGSGSGYSRRRHRQRTESGIREQVCANQGQRQIVYDLLINIEV